MNWLKCNSQTWNCVYSRITVEKLLLQCSPLAINWIIENLFIYNYQSEQWLFRFGSRDQIELYLGYVIQNRCPPRRDSICYALSLSICHEKYSSYFKQQEFPDHKHIEGRIKALSLGLWSNEVNYIIDYSILKYALTVLSPVQLDFLWDHVTLYEEHPIMYFG